METNNCIFCDIVAGRAPTYRVWESDTHLAFLSIYPNTEGVTVVISKTHLPSYIFDAEPSNQAALFGASAQVARKLERAFPDVGRVGVIFEGFGVDHLHAKLFPMHGTKHVEWKQIRSQTDLHFDQYEGYLASNNYYGIHDEELKKTFEKIQSAE